MTQDYAIQQVRECVHKIDREFERMLTILGSIRTETLGIFTSSRELACVLEIVSSYCGVPINRIMSRNRRADIVWTRQVSMWLLRKTTSFSMRQIADAFGGFDCGTILSNCKRVESIRATECAKRKETNELMEIVKRKMVGMK